MWISVLCLDEKSAAIVVRVRTILRDRHVDIRGAPFDGIARTRWFSMAVESVSDLCCLAHQGRPMQYPAIITNKRGRTTRTPVRDDSESNEVGGRK